MEREIERIAQEGRKVDSDIRTHEDEAATLHKRRVRKVAHGFCIQVYCRM